MLRTKNYVFPLVSIFIFSTLMASLFISKEVSPIGQQVPVALGLLAFSLTLTEVFIALRFKTMERKIGLPMMYSIHGTMAIILMIAAIAHIGNELNAQKNFTVLPIATPAGFMAMALLVLTTLTGIFILSNRFIRKSPTFKRLKESVFKRELGLMAHRFSILAVLAIFAHMMAVDFVRSNILLSVLSGLYVVLAVGGYIGSKIGKKVLPPYVLQHLSQHNPNIYELEFEPQMGTLMTYKPGQYVFVRFIKSALPKESHPFSISSAPLSNSTSLKVMIKNSGDYTSLMNQLKSGDIATLEGPYGNFMDINTAIDNSPLVMLAGGIGITPILSILRSQIQEHNVRRMVLVWGLASQKNLMLLDELKEMKQQNGSFSYYITFSKEHVDSFDSGQITQEYLKQIGVHELYSEADFFICGPAPMMDSMKGILKDNKVDPDRIHIEEFSF